MVRSRNERGCYQCGQAGLPATPRSYSLVLLPSGPDTVRRFCRAGPRLTVLTTTPVKYVLRRNRYSLISLDCAYCSGRMTDCQPFCTDFIFSVPDLQRFSYCYQYEYTYINFRTSQHFWNTKDFRCFYNKNGRIIVPHRNTHSAQMIDKKNTMTVL